MSDTLNKRRAGILLHITSLPGNGKNGDLGRDARYFVDFLHNTGVSVWQTLPLGATHSDGSPYQCLSAHAGNPDLINIDSLTEAGWLARSDTCNECTGVGKFRKNCLVAKAFEGFLSRAETEQKKKFKCFCQEKAFWLDDYALFMALRDEFDRLGWNQWPESYKNREKKALKDARARLKYAIDCFKFEQYLFFQQWMALKDYANRRGVLLFGDIPLFVSYDSADVWANRNIFKLDGSGEMQVVAGVPPDYFSATGQRWGNPHYDWDYLQKTGFEWWLGRLKTQFEQFDMLRIDHFRGLEASWEIPAHEPTAQIGAWVKAPGRELLLAIKQEFQTLPLIAEDLGIITQDVEVLRDEFNLPGMKILQFAFDGSHDNPYLPINHVANSVVYTGTHDNDTTLGWTQKLRTEEKNFIYEYLGFPANDLHVALMQVALASVANLVIIPMQDILELGSEHRMNTPGTIEGNWQWRFQWQQLTPERASGLAHWVDLFNRRP